MSLRVTDPLLPRLVTEFSLPLSEVAHVISLFSVTYGLSQLCYGPLGDRFGKYLVIACACAASAVTTVFCALAPNFALLLVARLLAGGTASAIMPLSMAWIGDVVPYEIRQSALARFLIGQILGVSAGSLLGGFAADFLDWRAPFEVIAVIFFAMCLVLFRLNRRLPVAARAVNATRGSPVAEFRQVLNKPWARVVLATVFLEGAFLFGAFAFIASHFHRTFGLSLSQAGSVTMLFGFGGMLFATVVPALVRRLGEAGLSAWGGIMVALSLLLTGLGPTWWCAIPGCFFAGLGFYMFHNTLQTNATQMAPERRGAAVAAFASCFFLGQSAGVGAASMFVEKIGTGPVIAIGAVGVLIVALIFSRLLVNSRQQR